MAKVTPWVVTAVLIVAGVILAFSSTREDISDRSTMGAIFDSLQYPEYLSVVALVNGAEISSEPVAIEAAVQEDLYQLAPEAVLQHSRGVLDSLISTELLYQESGRRALLCTADEVLEVSWLMTRGPEMRAGFAAYYGVPDDEVHKVPELLFRYERWCARTKLWKDVLGVDRISSLNAEQQLAQDEFVQMLKQAAVIEILEPSLQ